MKTNLILLFGICMLFSVSLHGQFGVDNCFECRDNSAVGRKSMASGYNNIARGYCSAAIGMANEVAGDYSFVTGYQSYCSHQFSAIIGSFDTITNFHSFILGSFSKATGKNAIVVGNNSKSLANYAISIGHFVHSTSSKAFTIGMGQVDNPLINSSSQSLFVGFNSNLPTFIVDRAPGVNKTGRIGIGNVPEPQAKLHIRSDWYESALIRIENTNTDSIAGITFGDGTQSITTSHQMPFTFNSGQNDYYFENGNVGIGKNMPDANLHILSANNNSRLRLEHNNLEGSFKSWDFNNANGTLKFQYGSSTSGKPVMADKMVITATGNIGIGTTSIPTEKLEVAGNIAAEAIRVAGLQILDNNQGTGKILQSDAAGNASWVNPEWKVVADRLITNHIVGIRITQGDIIYGEFQIGKEFTISGAGINDNKIIASNLYWQQRDQTRIFDGSASSIGFDDNTGNITFNTAPPGLADDPIIWQSMTFTNQGQLGIGTTDLGGYTLAVAGKIRSTELVIENLTEWYDCVFEEDYQLPSLSEIETFVRQNKHLPEVPSEADVKANGIALGEMNAILLKKIEELTLHVIQQQKQMEKQQTEIDLLKAKQLKE